MNYKQFLPLLLIYLISNSCTDPVTPEFDFQEGLIFIEGFASTTPGNSFVAINESAVEFGVYVVKFVENAEVRFENVNTGETLLLTEIEGSYQAPQDFAVATGEEWKLVVFMPNGKRYESTPELVLNPVPITGLDVEYDPEVTFDVGRNRFIPGHATKVSFADPPDDTNYYYWTYRTYENLEICEKCVGGIWRNEECQAANTQVVGATYFLYPCQTDCWRIRFPQSIAIFSDEFSNGKTTANLDIGNLLLYNKEDMVVEVQQISLTPSAYEYYKILKDIIDNSSGLNAPPPAPLVGNLFNPDDSEDFVFGRFTSAASSSASLFIDRTFIAEQPLEDIDPLRLEPTLNSPFSPPATTSAPCTETRFRTAVIPPGWVEN